MKNFYLLVVFLSTVFIVDPNTAPSEPSGITSLISNKLLSKLALTSTTEPL